MKEAQKSIYYIIGESKEQVAAFVECMRKWGFKVVYMTKSNDQCCMQEFREFDGKSSILVTKEDLELPVDEEKKKMEETKAKLRILDNKVEKVTIFSRLMPSPYYIVSQHSIIKAQALQDIFIMGYMMTKKHLEGNPNNPIVETLWQKAKVNKNNRTIKDQRSRSV